VVRLPFPTSTPDFRLIHAYEPIPARAPISPRVRPTLRFAALPGQFEREQATHGQPDDRDALLADASAQAI
jgi:hypothetical protein